MQNVFFRDLDVIDYESAWQYQEKLLQENISIKSEARRAKQQAGVAEWPPEPGAISSTVNYLLLLEHPPVYTLGKSGHVENMLITKEQMQQEGIAYFNTNRGGDITFHGPGQLVGYPVIDLEKFYTDIGKYLRDLEEVIILTLAAYGLKGGRSAGETGVWLDPEVTGRERKICALGVRCSRWITMHGFAFNVNTNLGYFKQIIPCGIRGKQVTSLQKELGVEVPIQEVKQHVKANFERVFDVQLIH